MLKHSVSLSFLNCVYVLVVYENAKRYQAYGLIFISDECFWFFRSVKMYDIRVPYEHEEYNGSRVSFSNYSSLAIYNS